MIFSVLLLCSCATDAPAHITLEIDEPNRIRFSGKGAGAGMMLVGAMGPMGIAIGAAIDEGIAKDIDSAARRAGLDIESIVRSQSNKIGSCVISGVHVKRYGFSMLKSSDELAVAQIKMSVTIKTANNNKNKELEYSFVDGSNDLSAPLESLKIDGALAIKMLRQAFSKLIFSAC